MPPFATEQNAGQKDKFYDLTFDERTIEESIWQIYGISPSEQDDMLVSDWLRAIEGLGKCENPLTTIIRIRSETNKDRLKHYGDAEKQIRREWAEFKARQSGNTVVDSDLERANADAFQSAMKQMYSRKK